MLFFVCQWFLYHNRTDKTKKKGQKKKNLEK